MKKQERRHDESEPRREEQSRERPEPCELTDDELENVAGGGPRAQGFARYR